MTHCYCAECRCPLTTSMFSNDAYCAECKNDVATSWFEIPVWIVGVLVVLMTIPCL